MAASERAPLLAASRREEEGDDIETSNGNGNGKSTPLKNAARWVTRHAVALFAGFLVLAVIVALAVFFGGKWAFDLL